MSNRREATPVVKMLETDYVVLLTQHVPWKDIAVAALVMRRHLDDQRTVLHSTRVAYRAAKRHAFYNKATSFPSRLARVALLHDVLEDANDPLAAALDVGRVLDPVEAQAVWLLTRQPGDTDAAYFARMLDGPADEMARFLAVLVKVEDSWDNQRDAWTDFKPKRHVKFAMKTAMYVLPLARKHTPDLAREMEADLLRAVERMPKE